MDVFQTTTSKKDNIIIPEEISIKVEPELVLLDDDDEDDHNDGSKLYGQGMSICQTEYEEYDQYDGPEVVGNTDAYMSYDEIQLQNELETSQTTANDDVILIESDSDGNEGNSSDIKVSYECNLCFKTVATSYNLRRHMMIHSGERPYCCDICDKRFREFSDLKKHRKVHVHNENFKCMICYSETPMPDDPTKCSKCCKKEVQYQAENIIIRDASIPRLEGNKRAYICSVCDRIFGSSHNLKRHHMIHTGEKPYKCDWVGCPKYFRELSTLRKHRGTHSKALEYIAYVKQPLFECNVCNMKFMSQESLSEHIKGSQHYSSVDSDLTSTSLRCPTCSKVFRSPQHLHSHILTH
ncbi:hypothetical protein HA402_009630 [Bradysia odoriphaga]|nr:hypothetical protein HA402_009630 [Bradysia odoriphaga]